MRIWITYNQKSPFRDVFLSFSFQVLQYHLLFILSLCWKDLGGFRIYEYFSLLHTALDTFWLTCIFLKMKFQNLYSWIHWIMWSTRVSNPIDKNSCVVFKYNNFSGPKNRVVHLFPPFFTRWTRIRS